MKINVFKHDGLDLFNNLEQYNTTIQETYDLYELLGRTRSTWWFDPKRWKEQECVERHTSKFFKRDELLHDSDKYNICLYPPNYLTIFLIYKLYAKQKDILIEDACTGDGRFFVFLSKMGYTNFSALEDFSQVNKLLFDGMIANNSIKCELNNHNINPIVVNHIGYPVYPKPFLSTSVELLCLYPSSAFERVTALKEALLQTHQELCVDANNMSIAYARKDKYEEFYSIIKSYEEK